MPKYLQTKNEITCNPQIIGTARNQVAYCAEDKKNRRCECQKGDVT